MANRCVVAKAFRASGGGRSAVDPEGGPNPPGTRRSDGLRADEARDARAFGLLPWATPSIGLLVALAAVSIATGSWFVPLHKIQDALFDSDPKDGAHLVVRELRPPCILTTVIAGICLGLTGAPA